MRASTDIQYAPLPMPRQVPPQPPEWLQWLGKLLEGIFAPLGRWLGMGWPLFQKVLIGLAAIAVLLIVWQALRWWLARSRTAQAPAACDTWQPDGAAAAALLEDADRLAREGRYDEAVHLLLRRSVGQIEAARPGWLAPAATAREIAALPGLPEAARQAFETIAERVERSLFALRALGQGDWQTARAAYADFARASLAAADRRG